MICIDASDENSSGVDNAVSLQQRFEAMKARRVAAAARVKAAEIAKANKRTDAEKHALRLKFYETVLSYVGTPYSAARCGEGAPLYLDCCGLVRRVLLDLKEEFGFEVGPWNQSYLFDTLPTAVTPEDLLPGDLVFWTAENDDPNKKRQRQCARARARGLAHIPGSKPAPYAPARAPALPMTRTNRLSLAAAILSTSRCMLVAAPTAERAPSARATRDATPSASACTSRTTRSAVTETTTISSSSGASTRGSTACACRIARRARGASPTKRAAGASCLMSTRRELVRGSRECVSTITSRHC